MARTVRSKKRKAQMEERHFKAPVSQSKFSPTEYLLSDDDSEAGLVNYLKSGGEPAADGERILRTLEDYTGDPALLKINQLVSWLATNTPARTTIRQALAFVMIGEADTNNRPHTLSSLRSSGGRDVYDKEVFLTSIGRSYQLFLTPELSDDEMALGWVEQENDPDDKRVKKLRLTAEGKAKYAELRELLG